MQICQLDLNDVPVPLTKERALGIQTELWEQFNTGYFQSSLTRLEKEFGDDTAKFKKWKQQLILNAQKDVLPKYGYKASVDGVAAMRLEFQHFTDDPEVAANRRAISELIEQNPDDPNWERDPYGILALDEHASKPRLGLPYPSMAVPDAWSVDKRALRARSLSPGPDFRRPAAQGRRAGSSSPVRRAPARSPPPAARGGAAPVAHPVLLARVRESGKKLAKPQICQLDLDDLEAIPFDRTRALALQKELCDAFCAREFQSKLRKCEEEHAEGTVEFRKQQQSLVLAVQAEVIPRYGFQPSMEGVAEMRKAISETFADDPEIQANTEAINQLIGKTWGSHNGEQNAALAETASEWVKPRPRPRYEMAKQHVDLTEGYWVVTGGKNRGGLLVRLAVDTTSHAHHAVLEPGAVVKEMQVINGRLYYEKITGVGPNYGWVTLQIGDRNLLERYEGEIPVLRQISEPSSDAPKALCNGPAGELELLAIADEPKPGAKPSPQGSGERASSRTAETTSPDAKARPRSRGERPKSRAKANAGYFVVACGDAAGLTAKIAAHETAKDCPELLENGAVVKVLQDLFEWKYFARIVGAGPNYGWISMETDGAQVLKPFRGVLPPHVA